MSETIQAEDAKEWAAWLAVDPKTRARQLGFARDEVDSDGYTDIRLLAAKALHGRPFGFTWADVDRLTEESVVVGLNGGPVEVYDWLHDLADPHRRPASSPGTRRVRWPA